MMPKNRVAILHSVDSHWGLEFMPIADAGRDERGRSKANYASVEDQLHRALYDLNVGADFVFAEEPGFEGYDVLLVPPLYVASDALLQKIADFARAGGHVLLTLKSGFTNEWSTVRWTRAPGPLREAAGLSYQEFSSLKEPLSLKGDPFEAGAANRVSVWAELLEPEGAQVLASYDHPPPALLRPLSDALAREADVKVRATLVKAVAAVADPASTAPTATSEVAHWRMDFMECPNAS